MVTSEAEIRCLPFQGSQIRGEYSRHNPIKAHSRCNIQTALYESDYDNEKDKDKTRRNPRDL